VELALTLCELREFDRAREHYRRAMSLAPEIGTRFPTVWRRSRRRRNATLIGNGGAGRIWRDLKRMKRRIWRKEATDDCKSMAYGGGHGSGFHGHIRVMAQEATNSSGTPEAIGKVVSCTGTVQIGKDGQWKAAVAEEKIFAGQILKTGEQSSVVILFNPDLSAQLAAGVEIAAVDLLLKSQLEKAKAKIAAPTDTKKVEMQVTPLTGVRGTEPSEEKAEDLKREHYWNENVEPAK